MKTTAEERRKAVSIARRLLDTNEPRILDVGECDLLCRTLLDVQAVFRIHAPVIDAAKQCIDARGNVSRDYAAIFQNQLVPSVRALYAFEGREEGK